MVDFQLIEKIFTELTEDQLLDLKKLADLYLFWNDKVNIVSRKDTDNIANHHIAHSLLLSRFIQFEKSTRILDLGCGGGLPGLPLAIYFPECHFTLIDARRKKIEVVNEIIEKLKLNNVIAIHSHSTEIKNQFEFVLARAVTRLNKLWEWSMPLIDLKNQNNIMPNGLITYKGGNLKKELKELPKRVYYELVAMEDFIDLPYFEEKQLVYVQR